MHPARNSKKISFVESNKCTHQTTKPRSNSKLYNNHRPRSHIQAQWRGKHERGAVQERRIVRSHYNTDKPIGQRKSQTRPIMSLNKICSTSHPTLVATLFFVSTHPHRPLVPPLPQAVRRQQWFETGQHLFHRPILGTPLISAFEPYVVDIVIYLNRDTTDF